ncbi:hypothetical protein J6590_042417 [Homalodisca vitripennis]|nr:hypothetical protein J6590_042417 [Homalodisca vitripennis]
MYAIVKVGAKPQKSHKIPSSWLSDVCSPHYPIMLIRNSDSCNVKSDRAILLRIALSQPNKMEANNPSLTWLENTWDQHCILCDDLNAIFTRWDYNRTKPERRTYGNLTDENLYMPMPDGRPTFLVCTLVQHQSLMQKTQKIKKFAAVTSLVTNDIEESLKRITNAVIAAACQSAPHGQPPLPPLSPLFATSTATATKSLISCVTGFSAQDYTKEQPKITPKDNCVVCGAGTFMGCADCFTLYCSVNCQAKDWPSHSRTCKTSSRSNSGSRTDLCGAGDNRKMRQDVTNGFRSAANRFDDRPQSNDKLQNRFTDRCIDQFAEANQDERSHNSSRKNNQSNSDPPRNLFEERRSRYNTNKANNNDSGRGGGQKQRGGAQRNQYERRNIKDTNLNSKTDADDEKWDTQVKHQTFQTSVGQFSLICLCLKLPHDLNS